MSKKANTKEAETRRDETNKKSYEKWLPRVVLE